MYKLTKCFHDKIVYSRRMFRLKELLIPLLKNSSHILDVGCGDGKIDRYIINSNRIDIQGIDVLVRPKTYIPVQEYDGKNIPFKNGTFDTVMAIDVLHHTDHPLAVLQEMTRVSNKYVIIKDHVRHGIMSYLTLRVMDYVGNAHYNVRLPYNYMKNEEWDLMFKKCHLQTLKYQVHLSLYTGLLHLLFDRRLHFIVLLKKQET